VTSASAPATRSARYASGGADTMTSGPGLSGVVVPHAAVLATTATSTAANERPARAGRTSVVTVVVVVGVVRAAVAGCHVAGRQDDLVRRHRQARLVPDLAAVEVDGEHPLPGGIGDVAGAVVHHEGRARLLPVRRDVPGVEHVDGARDLRPGGVDHVDATVVGQHERVLVVDGERPEGVLGTDVDERHLAVV